MKIMHRPRSTAFEIFMRALHTQLLGFLVPLLAFSLVVLGVAYVVQAKQANQAVLGTAQALQDYMHNIYEQSDSLYLSMYHNDVMKAVDSLLSSKTISYADSRNVKMIMPWLRAVSNAGRVYDSIYIYMDNDSGRFLSSAQQNIFHLSSSSDREWLAEYEARRTGQDITWVSQRSYAPYGSGSPLPEKHILTIYRTIGSRWCLMLNLDADILADILDNLFLYKNESIFLMDGEQQILLSVNAGAVSDPAGALSAAKDGEITGDRHSLYTVVPMWNDQVRMLIAVPRASAFLQARTQMLMLLGLLVLCVLLCVLLAYIHSRRDQARLMALYRMFSPQEEGAPASGDLYTRIEQNIVHSYMRQESLEKALRQEHYDMQSMELLALQAQINPHFLVNTITTVFWMCLRLTGGKMNPACQMLENLNGFLTLLTGRPNEAISWQEEMDSLHCYLAIQSQRFQNRFSFSEEIDPAVLDRPVAKLLIQPMIENCFVHAMPEEGELHILLRVSLEDDGSIRITLRDDGVGMTPEQLRQVTDRLGNDMAYRHIGLYNVSKRLKLLYGLTDPMRIDSAPGQGTVISICLPEKPTEAMILRERMM